MRKILANIMLIAMILFVGIVPVRADETEITPVESDNAGDNNYINSSRWATTVKSYLYDNGDDTMTRVEYVNETIVVETYDAEGKILTSATVDMELDIFGGFYAGEEYNFLVFGQENAEESADVEVFRIVKYTKEWNRVESTGLYDCNTTVPFDAGSCRMTESDGYLLIRTSHEMYMSDDGLNHQSNVTIQVDIDEMAIADSYTKVMNSNYGYVSHSFNQYIQVDGTSIIAVDHGDAYPRAIALIRYNTDFTKGTFTPTSSKTCNVVNALEIEGTIGNNTTGAMVGGFEVSESAYLIAGTSVIQDEDFASRTTKNIFVSSIDKDTLEVTLNWITDYEEGEATTENPQLVKISDSKFLLMWMRSGTLYYTFLDEDGNAGDIYTANAELSDCQPIVIGEKVVWYFTDSSVPYFCSIDLANSNQLSILNKGDMQLFEYTISGSAAIITKCNSMAIPDTQVVEIPDTIEGYPVTRIDSAAFANCGYMKEVSIPSTVTYIGAQAFYGCSGLEKIEIPAAVTSIGDYAFYGCSSLEAIEVEEGNKQYSSIDGVLYDAGKTTLLVCPEGKTGEFEVPEGVTVIGDYAFRKCQKITKVTFPSSLETIGAYAFGYCTKLTDITIPDTVKTIGAYAFYASGYYYNTENWVDDLLYADGWLLDSTYGLSGEVTVQDGTKKMADYALAYQSDITKVNLPEGLENIGESGFYYSSSLEEVNIPSSVKEVGLYAFLYTSIYTTDDNWTDGVLYVDHWLIEAKSTVTLTNGEFTVADGTVGVAEYAVTRNYNIKQVNFPDTIKYINWYAFGYCYYLKNINKVMCFTVVDDEAFYNCNYAASIDTTKYIEHTLSEEWVVDVEPTCTEPGSKSRGCIYCDADEVVEEIPATGHTYGEWVVTKEASCSEEGMKTRTCTVEGCGGKETEVIEKTAHDYEDDYTTDKEPTCTEAGSKSIHCKNCEAKTEVEEIPATGHTYGEWAVTKEASCSEEGTKTRTCTVEGCESKETEVIVKKAHAYEAEYTVDKEATCTETGSKSIHCANCNVTKDVTVIPATGHNYVNSVCQSCGAIEMTAEEKETADKLGISDEGAKELTEFITSNNISQEVVYVTENDILTQKSEDVTAASYNVLSARATKATKNTIKLQWNKVKGADGYIIYGNKCGTANKYKKITELGKNVKTFTQKKLSKGTFYKYLVVAYKNVDGKKITIAASKTIHEVTTGGKYGNAKSVKVNKTKVNLKVKKTFTVKASEVKKDKTLKKHRKISYESTNTAIAAVNKNGKITAKGKGTCYVYVYAQNGMFKKIKVTVN